MLALASAAAFATSGTFARSLLDSGWSPGAAVTSRIAIAVVVLIVPAWVQLAGRWDLLRRNRKLILAYGVLAVAGPQLCYFNAVQTLSIGVALLLEYLGLILVVLWLWIRNGETPRRWTIVGILLAVAGLILILDVTGSTDIDPVGVMWGLGAAVGLALFFVLSAHDNTGLPSLTMAAAGMAVGAVVLAAAGVVGVLPMDFADDDVILAGTDLPWWTSVAGLSLIAAAFAYSMGIAATRALGSKLASFVGLSEVLFAVIFAWVLVDDVPLTIQLLGGVLIVLGVIAVRYDEMTSGAGNKPDSDDDAVLVDHLIADS